jgi:tryptophanyl-tRNA synthetase
MDPLQYFTPDSRRNDMNQTIVSGMRPTGAIHLGNYFGALENWIRLQKDYFCYFFVADWHALTTGYEDTEQYKKNISEMIADWISCGLDPKQSVFFLQSEIKEHAELHLLFSMSTPLSWLYRCPTYKDQLAQMKNMGSLSDIAGMLPGVDKKALSGASIDERALSRTEAIILSMTQKERENPSILNYSRKRRIAAGSGTKVEDINRLLKQFDAMQLMARQMAGGKLPKGFKGGRLPF